MKVRQGRWRWGRMALLAGVAATAALPALGARPGRVHYGGVYLYHFGLGGSTPAIEEERWQRLLGTPEVTYLCSQVSAPDPGATVVRRVREAAAAGKRVVLQIWWGGSGTLNWSRYSLAHIAMDAKLRQEFFALAVDPLLEKVGPTNIYGAHLLEETGMQFGVDIDVPGDPDELDDGDDNGSNWDQPSWLGCGGVAGYLGGPYVPNIRRYGEQFRQDTGLDLREAPLWSYTGGWRVYRDWVSRHLEAGAMVAFAEHLHRAYPQIKAFTWDSVDWGECGANSMRAMGGKVDGLIMDPYTTANGIYAAVRAPRLIDPDLEIIAVLWGCDDAPAGELLNRAAAAYAGGADVVSYFGDTSAESDATWHERVGQLAPFTRLSPFEVKPPPVLLLAAHGTWMQRLTGLAWFDVMSAIEADAVELSPYALVVLYGEVEHPGLQAYVRAGGRVLASQPPRFLLDEGQVREVMLATYPRKEEIGFRPTPWWREQLHLGERYLLEVTRRTRYEPATPAVREDHAVLVPYGQGEVCILQYPCGYASLAPERLGGLQQLLADLGRGLLLRAGQAEAAESAICAPGSDRGYLRLPARDGSQTVYCVSGSLRPEGIPLQGANLIGPEAPVLGRDVRAAVLQR